MAEQAGKTVRRGNNGSRAFALTKRTSRLRVQAPTAPPTTLPPFDASEPRKQARAQEGQRMLWEPPLDSAVSPTAPALQHHSQRLRVQSAQRARKDRDVVRAKGAPTQRRPCNPALRKRSLQRVRPCRPGPAQLRTYAARAGACGCTEGLAPGPARRYTAELLACVAACLLKRAVRRASLPRRRRREPLQAPASSPASTSRACTKTSRLRERALTLTELRGLALREEKRLLDFAWRCVYWHARVRITYRLAQARLERRRAPAAL